MWKYLNMHNVHDFVSFVFFFEKQMLIIQVV